MADPKKKKYGAKAKRKISVNAPSSDSARSAFIISRKNLENSSKKDLQSNRRAYENAKNNYYKKSQSRKYDDSELGRKSRLKKEQNAGMRDKMGYQTSDYETTPFKMIIGSKQKHDPNNFSQKDQNKMAKIPGAGKRRVVGGSGFIGYLGGAGLKAAGRMFKAFANTPKQLLAKATGHKAIKGKGGKTLLYEKDGLATNSFKGLFNKSVKDKPAYGIDQYSYAKSKGRSAVKTIKKGYPSVDPNLLKKYPTGPKLHKFHKDQAKKFMNKK